MGNAQRNVLPIKTVGNQEGLSIVIPAAGLGVRMKSYGPKPLIKITNEDTILSNQLRIIDKAFKNYQIILVVGYMADKVMNNIPPNVIAVENENFENTNVLRSIGMGLRAAQYNRVLLIHGDLVFNAHTLTRFIIQGESSLLLDSGGLMSNNEVACIIDQDENLISNMAYDVGTPWAQIGYFIGPELLQLQRLAWNRDNENMFTFEAINEIINNGGRFRPAQARNMKINDIDFSKDLHVTQHILESP